MRKHKKQEILDMVKALRDANEEVRNAIKSHNYSDAYNILAACQEGAYSIGTAIEADVKDPQDIITELEEYCDNAYRLGTALENEIFDYDSMLRTIDKQLDYFEEYVSHIIRQSYEIVFLPYKASMWDSLESIWKAASQDPDCKCYVVPIPYYEIIAWSKETVYRYEGDQFPEYVPITHFDDYNFEERKPDIIYIHNPYDQYNRVTSVHPAFYSFELKKYTQMLAYIPYFVTGGTIAEGFRYIPSYAHMDKIVIQSDKLIEFFEKSLPAKKIVALGSPKVDRILALTNGEKEIPKEWAPIIKDKKVVLYNTSLSGLLEYGETAIEKMEYIFSFFKSRRKEVILWRPHPLSKATLQSMRPQLYKKYCELERQFIEDNIGILDTTPDVSLSVAISDAYIGEASSSVVHLFGVAGKPIFLLNMKLSEETISERKNLVGCLDGCVENNTMWFMHCYYNALCKADIDTGKIEIVDLVPGEASDGEKLYHDTLKIGDKLFFTPHRTKELLVYDLTKKQFRKIAFRKSTQGERSQFTRMIRYKDYLYLLPTYYGAIVRYNSRTGDIKYYSDLVNDIRRNDAENNMNTPDFMNAMCIKGELLFMASAKSNAIMEFNMKTEKAIIHKVGKSENSYYRMECDGNDFWLIPHESKAIVRWNRETGKTEEYDEYPEGFIGDKNAFLSIIHCGEYMLAFPKKANMIVKIDIKTGYMSEFKLSLPYMEGEREEDYYSWPNNYYFVKKMDDTRILALTAYNCSLVIIDTKTHECTIKKLVIEKRKAIFESGCCDGNIPYACMESTNTFIEDFLDETAEKKIFDPYKQKMAYAAVISNMDGSCGEKIHNYMIKESEKLGI